MPTTIQTIRARAKRGPRMSRQVRAEYVAVQADLPTRRLSPEIMAKIRSEVDRLALSPDPRVRHFVEVMHARYPELTQ